MDPGSHVGFQISTKNKSGRGLSNEHFWQVWLKSVQRFQRRRVKCEKLTDGRMPTHEKSSHGLWPGELKKDMGLQAKKNTFDFIMFISYVINIIICTCTYITNTKK